MNTNLAETRYGNNYEWEKLNAVFYKDIHGRYIYCNDEFCKYVGLGPKEVIGKTDKDLYEYMKSFNIFKNQDEEVIKYKIKRTYKTEIKVENESKRNIEITKTPMLDKKDKVCGVVGVVKNIEESKSIDKEIEKLRSDFFSNLSHELGTPINTIMSSLQLLSFNIDTMKNVDINELKDISDIIRKNGFRLLKLTNNLVYVTELDAGEINLNLNPGDIVLFIENICMKASEFCKIKNINLVFDTNEEEYIGMFDRSIIEKIVLNLISNAIKYNKKNKDIEVNLNCSGDNIEIKVKDHGVGIPNRYTKRIFEKLSYVDDRLVKLNEGSGLGLYITSSLVKLCGGTINVESSLGEGSEFSIKLPLEKLEEDTILNERPILSGFDQMSIEFSDIY